ncbi:Holliday junction DNA helicase, partial [Salmonella enterica subsp. enterica serovar Virchow str. ATCC 51955]
EVKHDGAYSAEIAAQALDMLNVDAEGLTIWIASCCWRLLINSSVVRWGLDNLAAAIGEERETIEDVLEPYLIQQGFCSARRVGVWQRCAPGTISGSRRQRCLSA